MQQFPVLNLIVRYGAHAAIVVAIFAAALVLWLLYGSMGWAAVAVALVTGGVVFVLAKSYVELIVLITEMLVPR